MFPQLGKATQRGLQKCIKCGHKNGSRSLKCKNQECQLVLRRSLPIKSHIFNGSNTAESFDLNVVRIQYEDIQHKEDIACKRIYSVENYTKRKDAAVNVGRVFVETSSDGQQHCYNKSCQRSSHRSSGSVSLEVARCPHISSVMKLEGGNNVIEVAALLRINREVLIQTTTSPVLGHIPNEVMNGVWTLCNMYGDDIVQWVNKQTFAVRCTSALTFVHCKVSQQPGSSCGLICSCTEDNSTVAPTVSTRYCVHCYACFCALASDAKLRAEFNFLFTANTLESKGLQPIINSNPKPQIYRDRLIDYGEYCKKKRKLNTFMESSPIEEDRVQLLFHEWLAGLTETINNSMCFDQSGFPQPVALSVVDKLFNALHHRICSDCSVPGAAARKSQESRGAGKKRRLPDKVDVVTLDSSNVITRRPDDKLYTRFTWRINNVFRAKHIFDTAAVPLLLERPFIKGSDGKFTELYDLELNDLDELKLRHKTIQPHKHSTFLKIGYTSPTQAEPHTVTIEWIPDILPLSGVGQLTVNFTFGHKVDGTIVESPPLSSSPI